MVGNKTTKKCVVCSGEFETIYSFQKCCKKACKYKWDNQMRNLRYKQNKAYRTKQIDRAGSYYINNKKKVLVKAKVHRDKNKERINEKRRGNYKENEEYGKQCRKRWNDYYHKNSKKVNKNKTEYYSKGIGKVLKQYYEEKRRAAKSNCIHSFTKKEWLEKKKSTLGVCHICNKYIGIDKLSMDHIYPLSLAYDNFLKTGIKKIYTINDIQAICTPCNSAKCNRLE